MKGDNEAVDWSNLSSSLKKESPLTDPKSKEIPKPTMEYLADLINERKQLGHFSKFLPNVERILDQEIHRVHMAVYKEELAIEKVDLPEPEGSPISIREKIYIPSEKYPESNFVGRILGPRGMTLKQLENETGCKIMIRGRGSLRDTRKEDENRGKPNWEHLEDELHVVVQCDDTPNRAHLKLDACINQINKLLIPTRNGIDSLKRKQLMELAIFKGTFTPNKQRSPITALSSPTTPVSPLQSSFLTPPPNDQKAATISSPTTSTPSALPQFDYNTLMSQLSLNVALASLCARNGLSNTPTSPLYNPLTSLFNASSSPNSPGTLDLNSNIVTPNTGTDEAFDDFFKRLITK